MDPILEALYARRDEAQKELDELLAKVADEKRTALTDDESSKNDELVAEIRRIDERITELADLAKRKADADAARKLAGDGPAKVTEPDMYADPFDDKKPYNGNSYFRDLAHARVFGSDEAADRLRKHTAYENEKRALGNTGAAGGSGGEFAPPEWLVNQWVNLIRPGRVTADLFPKENVPAGVSSVNYPKLLTGTTTAVQSTQNTALSQTDLTTGYVQTGFATIGGKQVSSQQLLDQTAINFDRVILLDLAMDYGQRVGNQVFNGTGTGSGTGAVINGLQNATVGSTQTWTQASPTVAGFYGQCGALLAAFLGKRLLPPNCWVMHPRRWYWLASAVDSANRPLLVPNGPAFNQLGTQDNPPQAQGLVGTFHGLPVYSDPQVPINLGAGTNQDIVYLLRTDDLVLFESAPQTETFRETYADSLGVLFRLYAYVATILNRHPESIGVLTGTGLVTPTFAS